MTSEALKQMLEDTGLFQVDIAISRRPSKHEDIKPVFSASGWCPWTTAATPGHLDPESFRFLRERRRRCRRYHSALTSFHPMAEYNEIIGLAGWGERTDEAGLMSTVKDGQVVRDNWTRRVAAITGPEHSFLVVNRDYATPSQPACPEPLDACERRTLQSLAGRPRT